MQGITISEKTIAPIVNGTIATIPLFTTHLSTEDVQQVLNSRNLIKISCPNMTLTLNFGPHRLEINNLNSLRTSLEVKWTQNGGFSQLDIPYAVADLLLNTEVTIVSYWYVAPQGKRSKLTTVTKDKDGLKITTNDPKDEKYVFRGRFPEKFELECLKCKTHKSMSKVQRNYYCEVCLGRF